MTVGQSKPCLSAGQRKILGLPIIGFNVVTLL